MIKTKTSWWEERERRIRFRIIDSSNIINKKLLDNSSYWGKYFNYRNYSWGYYFNRLIESKTMLKIIIKTKQQRDKELKEIISLLSKVEYSNKLIEIRDKIMEMIK